MNKTIGIHLGALSDTIENQLESQGFTFDTKEVRHFQKVADALLMVSFAGLITDSVREKANQKLYKKVIKHVCKHNKLHEVKK